MDYTTQFYGDNTSLLTNQYSGMSQGFEHWLGVKHAGAVMGSYWAAWLGGSTWNPSQKEIDV